MSTNLKTDNEVDDATLGNTGTATGGQNAHNDYIKTASQMIQDQYDQRIGAATAQLGYTTDRARKTRDGELDYAGILYERMKKYMPLQQKAAGMSTMGIAQTGLNDVTNTHMNRRAAIQGQYDDTVAAAQMQYASAAAEAGNAYTSGMLDIYREEANKQEQEKQQKVDLLVQTLTNHGYNYTEEEAKAMMTDLDLDEQTKNMYMTIWQDSVNKHEEAENAEADDAYQKKLQDIQNALPLFADDPEGARAYLEIIMASDPSVSGTGNAAAVAAENGEGIPMTLSAEEEASTWLRDEDVKMLESIVAGYEKDAAERDKDKKAEEQADAYQEFSYRLEILDDYDLEGQKALLEEYKSKISEDAYNYALEAIKQKENDTAFKVEGLLDEGKKQENADLLQRFEAAQAAGYPLSTEGLEAYEAAVVKGNEELVYGEERYVIDGKALKEDAAILNGDKFKVELAKESGTSNPKSGKIKNGTAISIEKNVKAEKGGNPGVTSYDYYVYFNGSWYPAEHVGRSTERLMQDLKALMAK